jgi:UDP-N-acetylglucosamine 2-epimerase
MAKILTSFHAPFLPILKPLALAGHHLIAMHPQFAQMLRDLDLPAKAVAEFVDPGLQSQGFSEATRVLRTITPPKNGLGPGAIDFMRQGLGGFLYPRMADVCSFVLALERIRPDFILLHNDVEPLNRAAALWAQKHPIPCLHVPHAVYLQIEKGDPGDDVHDLVTASHLAVAGWFQKDWYKARGARHIVETGLPQFDKLAALPLDQKRARMQLGLEPHKPTVTYASSWRQDTNLLGCHDGVQETYLAMLQVIKRLPDIQFVIKLHPRAQDGQWHYQAAQQAGLEPEQMPFMTAQHTEVVLQASDVIFTYSGSNLLLEASFVPWLRLMATQGYENDPEVFKVNTDPPDVEVMANAVIEALYSAPPDYGAFKAKYLGRCDGRAAERITKLIMEGLSVHQATP